ncbi:MAG: hypothetical protein IJV39_06465 [Ruminococcus sp.]|nr:hypothetical protein [Ruminococcus sp.]
MSNRKYSDREKNNNGYSDDFYRTLAQRYGAVQPSDERRRLRRQKREALRRRKIRRIKMVVTGIFMIAIVVSIVIGISMGIKSCINSGAETANGFKTVTKDNSNNKTTSASNVTTDNADKNDPLSFVTPQITDDDTDGQFSSQNSAIYLWNNAAYEIFGSSADRSDIYSDVINRATEKLGDKIKVYSMMIPLHSEMNLPERLKTDSGSTSQADNIYNAYSKFTSAQPINIYNVLAEHNNEYLYFNSDHHWTGLGAYYAYTAFCEQTDQEPMTISEEGTHSIEGFTGSFHTYGTGLVDRVDYYDLPYETNCTLYPSADSAGQPADIYYENEEAGENTYGVFINGDQPKFIINSECDSDKKIAVVKESFGNAFVPYLSANYKEIHVLDMRYCGITDLKQYCEENEIDEVLFMNNMMSANSADRITDIENLLG